jgi:glycosyltransferase involved in cell wall biosynthesis
MGGAEAFALRLCSWIDNVDPERGTRIVCPAGSELARRCEALGIEVLATEYPLPAPRNALSAARALWRLRRLLLRAPSGTLLIANTARAQAYAILAARTLGGSPQLVSLMHEQDSAQRPAARWALQRWGRVAAVGDAGVKTYRDALPSRTIAYVTNFMTPDELARAVAERLPAPGGERPVVGVLSRMFAGKGIVELVEELAGVPEAWSQLRVGAPFQDAAYTDAVRARVGAHDLGSRVSLLGNVADVAAFVAGVDVIVVPSTET